MTKLRNRALKSVGKILLGSLIGQGLVIAISPLLTRFFSPEDFTALAVVTAMSAILGGFVTLGWEAALVLPSDVRKAYALSKLGYSSTIIMTVLILLASWLFRDPVARLFGVPALLDFWWIVPTTVGTIGLYKVSSAWLVREQLFNSIALRNLSQGVGQSAFNLGFGLAGIAPFGLIGGVAAGRLVALAGMAFGARRRPLSRPTSDELAETAKAYRRFPLYTTWSYAIATFGLQLPVLMFAGLYSALEVGFFALTLRVLAGPVSILSDAVRQFYEGRVGQSLRNQSIVEVRQLFIRLAILLALVGTFPTILLIVFGPYLFGLIFGSEWSVAGEFARYLALLYFLQLIVSPLSGTLTLLQHQKTQLLWDVSRALLSAGAIILAWVADATMPIAVISYASAQAFSYLVLFILSFSMITARIRR